MSVEKQEYPIKTNDMPIRITGFIILLLIFGVLGGWAAYAPLDSASSAKGVVNVASYRKTVQHLEGGLVKDIRVKDGDSVKKGDILLILDDTQFRAQLEIIKGQFILSQALKARLLAEQAGVKKINYPEGLKNHQEDERIANAITTQQQVFSARRTAIQGERAVLKQRIEQLNAKIKGLTALRDSKQELLTSYRAEGKEQSELLESGFADKNRIQELERRAAQMQGELAEHLADIASAKIQIGETRLQILQLDKKLKIEVTEQLGKVNAELNDLTEKLQALEDRVKRSIIYAPDSGMIIGMQVHTIGAVIGPGKPILDIVPQGQELIVEAQVSPVDIDKVHSGLLADIRFSAFSSRDTPVIEGKVMNISADRLTDPETRIPYYLARVKITPKGYKQLGNLVLIPGMPAEVYIKLGERTLLEYLIQPITNALARAFKEE